MVRVERPRVAEPRGGAPRRSSTTITATSVTDLTEEDYQEYYNGFANRVLWPVLHYRLDLAEFSRRDLSGYLRVNEHFAAELQQFLQPDDVIWVHDYHLIPLAKALRERGHRQQDRLLPAYPAAAARHPHRAAQSRASHSGAVPLRSDRLADRQRRGEPRALFHQRMPAAEPRRTHLHRRRPHGAHRHVPDRHRDRRVRRLARRAVRSPFVQGVLESLAGRTMIIGVDRLDYSKGIALRMEAFERFLARLRRMARQGHLPADHAQEPLHHPGILADGAADQHHAPARSTATTAKPRGRRSAT